MWVENVDEVYELFAIFGNVSNLVLYFGLTITILGFLAFALNKRGEQRRQWGKRICFIGLGFSLLGANFTWFLEAIVYVFEG